MRYLLALTLTAMLGLGLACSSEVEPTATSPSPAVQPTVVDLPDTPSPEPTATPEPEVTGLGISRSELQQAYLRRYENRGMDFSPVTEQGNVLGMTEDQRITVVISGPGDDVTGTVAALSMSGFMTDDDIRDGLDSLYLLASTVMPEWDGHREWITKSLKKAGTDQVHYQELLDGILVEYLNDPEAERIVFRIRVP